MNLLPASLSAYALVVIASGVWNRIVNGGEKGLWFGLVMGGTAGGAALLVARGRHRPGLVFGVSSAVIVGGWFLYETVARNGGVPTPRMGLVMAASLTQALLLLKGSRPGRAEGRASIEGTAGEDGVPAA